MKKIKKIYLASPFFNKEQIERLEFMETKLRELGFEVFSPREAGVLNEESTVNDAVAIYYGNLNAIHKCDALFGITDGKDVGTIFEVGYATALNKTIVLFCETLNGQAFNVMLAKCADFVLTSRDEVEKVADLLNYEGGDKDAERFSYVGNVY